MEEQKRYYWLKLDKDFFHSKRIKKLRKIAGGDTYVIIYLKMQLLSLTTNGILEYTGLENSFAEELALDIDEDVENVKVTVQFLICHDLLVTSDQKEYELPFVQNSILSAAASTIRSQKSRNNKQKVLQCNSDATLLQQNCNVEIDIEKEKDIDTDKEIEEKKNIKKKDHVTYFPDEKLNDAFIEYVEMRKKIKKPLTDHAIDLVIKKLIDLATIPFSDGVVDSDMEIKILEQSIMNSWQGLFPLKSDKQQSGKNIDWSKV